MCFMNNCAEKAPTCVEFVPAFVPAFSIAHRSTNSQAGAPNNTRRRKHYHRYTGRLLVGPTQNCHIIHTTSRFVFFVTKLERTRRKMHRVCFLGESLTGSRSTALQSRPCRGITQARSTSEWPAGPAGAEQRETHASARPCLAVKHAQKTAGVLLHAVSCFRFVLPGERGGCQEHACLDTTGPGDAWKCRHDRLME